MHTPEQYAEIKRVFANGNDVLDYAYRNLMVGDDEQTRILDCYELSGAEYIAEFPEAIRDRVQELIKQMETDRLAEEDLAKLLLPYISNRGLADLDFNTWEAVLLSTGYEEYVEATE